MATTTKGIYYPDDGTKAADVLTDLKQMAKSIDETIGKEVSDNKYDDTEIKKDISDIKKEQETQNADIEKINQNVDTLKEQIPVSENKGEVIKLTDSSNMNAVKFNIFGNQIQNGEPSEQNPIAIQTVNQKINLTVSNENLAVMNGIGTDVELTENGIKIINTKRIHYLSTFKIKKGQTIKVGLKMLTAVTGNTAISCYVNGKSNDDFKSINMKDCKINEVQERSYTATEDCEINFSLSGNTNNEMFEFQLWANFDKLGEYTVAKNQTLSVYVQQEMLSGDTFKNENGNWKEIHNWQKILSYNGENVTTEYISSTGALTTGATVYYRLTTPTELNCTQTQIEQLNTLANISTYKNVTYIYSTDTVSPIFEITYRKDLATLEKNTKTKNTEQDELITKLQEYNQKLKNALINAETEEAKSLHVTDANKFGQLEILGNHEQETREGKNLFKLPDSGNNNGIEYTKNDDGTFNISGTAQEQASFSIIVPLANSGFEQGKSYTVSSNIEIGNIKYYVHSCTASGAWNKTLLDFINETSKTKEMLAPSTDYISLNIVVFKDVTVNYQNVTVQIEEGTVATEYEQYGASPSPNYPSKVKCLGSNKNLLQLKDVAKVNVDSGSYEVKDNVLYINGTLNSVKNLFFELENSVQLKGDYTIKNNYENLSENVININLRDGNHSSNFVLSFNNNTTNYKTEKNLNFVAKYLYVQLNVGTYNHFQIKLKLEEGTEATSYSPPGQGSTKIKKDNGLHNIQVEQGSLNSSTGTIINADTRLRTADFVEIKNFNKIDCKGMTTCNVFFYDTNKTYLGRESTSWVTLPFQFEILQNAVYLKAIFRKDDEVVTPDMIKNLRLYSEETDYLLYIQQEMLSGDYFVKEADGWKEVHNFGKYVFDGTENYIKSPLSNDDYLKIYTNTAIISAEEIKFDGKMFATRYKNIGIYSSSTTDNRIACRSQLHTQISTEFLTENTAEAYKALLAEWKNEGKPLAVFYELINQIKLACTEAQSAVLEELNNLDLFNGVNNIITAEDIALLKLKYALNAKIYIDNLLVKQSENTVAEEV